MRKPLDTHRDKSILIDDIVLDNVREGSVIHSRGSNRPMYCVCSEPTQRELICISIKEYA